MTGLGMLLKSFGIEIDPAEITAAYDRVRQELPLFAQNLNAKVAEIDNRLRRIETMQNQILNLLTSGRIEHGNTESEPANGGPGYRSSITGPGGDTIGN